MRSRLRFRAFIALIAVGTAFNLTGCGSGSSGSANALEEAFPAGLALASPFASSDAASAAVSALVRMQTDEDEEETLSFAEKEERINNILNATSLTGCFDYETTLTREKPTVACYGPAVTLSGAHPDGAFTGGGSQNLPTGDLGIWDELEDDEACISAKVNSEFYGIEGKIDFAMLTMASAICVANNSGLTLPAEGASLDLSDEMTAAIAAADADDVDAPIEPTAISLSRLADTADGRPVYQLSLTGSIENDDASTTPVTMTLKHIPASETSNATYQGLLQYTAYTDDIPSTNCGGGSHTLAGSALYQKVSATDMRARYQQAVFCGEATSEQIFNDDGEADRTHKRSGCGGGDDAGASANGWGDDFTRVIVNTNPNTGLGSMIYAWQAGRCDDQTRVFNAEITATGGTDGAEGGCGYFGYGPDMADADAGDIGGMICNWAGPGSQPFGSKTLSDLVQRQCVTRDVANGKFDSVAATLNIDYAPTLSCDSNGALLCDGVACVTTNDLLDSAEMSFTAPSDPAALPE